MKFNTYQKSKTIAETLVYIQAASCRPLILNGGTDLMIEQHVGGSEEEFSCIDISSVQELKEFSTDGAEVYIGAGMLLGEIAKHEEIRRTSLVLDYAAGQVGSPQIRNRGTIGGNIITAAQCSDTIPVLLTLDAVLHLMGVDGSTRDVKIGDFFTGPKQTDIREGELLTGISYQSLEGKGYTGRFFKLIRREAVAKSRLNFSLLMKLQDDLTIEDVRIAVGSALSVPDRFSPVEQALVGKRAGNEVFHAAAGMCADYVLEVTGNRWSTPYKQPVIRDVMYRLLCQCSGIKE